MTLSSGSGSKPATKRLANNSKSSENLDLSNVGGRAGRDTSSNVRYCKKREHESKKKEKQKMTSSKACIKRSQKESKGGRERTRNKPHRFA